MKKIIKSILLLSVVIVVACGEDHSQEQPATTEHATTQSHEQQQAQQAIAKNVDVKEFEKLISSGRGVIVDVRTPGEFNRGYIEGARNINIADNFKENIQKLDKNEPVYVYCAVGGRSSQAMRMMQQMGFKEVYNLVGGYNAWAGQHH